MLPGSLSILAGKPTEAPSMMDADQFASALEWNRLAEAGELSPNDQEIFKREIPKSRDMAQRVWEDSLQEALVALAAVLAFLAGALGLILLGRSIRYVLAGE
jgi:hypothetical protein